MKWILAIILLVLPRIAHALPSNDCLELKSERLRLALIASNLANVNTTRSREGGPYKAFVITHCTQGKCDAEKTGKFVMKYLPGHPDADENGYVNFPDLNQQNEFSSFNMTALKLRLLARAHFCGSKIIGNLGENSFIIQYDVKSPYAKSEVKEDIFNVGGDQQVLSWQRLNLNGVGKTLNLRANGELVSFQ